MDSTARDCDATTCFSLRCWRSTSGLFPAGETPYRLDRCQGVEAARNTFTVSLFGLASRATTQDRCIFPGPDDHMFPAPWFDIELLEGIPMDKFSSDVKSGETLHRYPCDLLCTWSSCHELNTTPDPSRRQCNLRQKKPSKVALPRKRIWKYKKRDFPTSIPIAVFNTVNSTMHPGQPVDTSQAF